MRGKEGNNNFLVILNIVLMLIFAIIFGVYLYYVTSLNTEDYNIEENYIGKIESVTQKGDWVSLVVIPTYNESISALELECSIKLNYNIDDVSIVINSFGESDEKVRMGEIRDNIKEGAVILFEINYDLNISEYEVSEIVVLI